MNTSEHPMKKEQMRFAIGDACAAQDRGRGSSLCNENAPEGRKSISKSSAVVNMPEELNLYCQPRRM